MVQAATKRKCQAYADWIFILSHSVLNENWEKVYKAMLGEKVEKNEMSTEHRITKLSQIFGSMGMKYGRTQ